MMRRRTVRPSAGFTLVEVLIALSLLTVLVLLLTAALRSAGQTESRIDHRFEQADQVRVASHFLREILGRASLRPATTAGQVASRSGPLFAASAQEIAWVGVLPPGYGIGGRHFLRLAIEPAGPSTALVLRYVPWSDLADFPDWAGAAAQVIVPHAGALDIRYLDDRSGEWRSDWPVHGSVRYWALPAAVDLQLAATDLPWPLLTVRMAALPASDPDLSGFVIGGRQR